MQRSALFLVLTLLVQSLPAAIMEPTWNTAEDGRNAGASGSKKSDTYAAATAALDAEDWKRAAELFREVATKGGGRADAALYWLAYAQQKSGRSSDALAAIGELKRRYASSGWSDDAAALELEIRQSSGQRISPERIEDDELKLIAIAGLLHGDQDRAVSLIDKILKSTSSRETKERALFILGQSNSPRARTLLDSVARGGSGPALQIDAIHSIGVAGGVAGLQLLTEVYRTSKNRDVKKTVLQALMIQSDRARLLQVASGDGDPEMRSEAAMFLGAMGAKLELARLYDSEQSVEVRQNLIRGLFVAGDVTKLAQIARTDKNDELRVEAIQGLGTMSRQKTGALLLDLWGVGSVTTKRAVIDGLFIQGNGSALISLARKETNRELKRELVQRISLMQSSEAQNYMLEILGD